MTKLILAIPSKGRLKEQAEHWFSGLGLSVTQEGGGRGYQARLDGIDGIDLRLMSAGDIAGAILSGDVHMGITGHDLLAEASDNLDRLAHLTMPLRFGRADVVVAVPTSWIDVRTMADLADVAERFRRAEGRRLKVATKYGRLTAAWFAHHGVMDHRIVDSAGATEGAPAAGSAELIVDITTTGQTLAANRLRVLDDGLILKSQAWLASSAKAVWTSGARDAAAGLLSEAAAAEAASKSVLVHLECTDVEQALTQLNTFGSVQYLNRTQTGLSFSCLQNDRSRIVSALSALAGSTIIVAPLQRLYDQTNQYLSELNEFIDRI